jgi:hypothetical protein
MARYSGGWRTTGAGSTTLPAGALAAGASNDIYVVEIGVWNTTVTECNVAVRRLTTAGTPGSGQSEIPWDPDTTAATGTLLDTYTSTGPTITAGSYRWAMLGAAKGSGVIWTFAGKGLRIPKGTSQGLCVIPGTGTGQILDVYFEWDE